MRLYEHYKDARDKAWAFLINNAITSFPVDIVSCIRKEKITLLTYGEGVTLLAVLGMRPEGEAMNVYIRNVPHIFYDPIFAGPQHLRFTLAHELGHIILGHAPPYSEFTEREANIFARNILMPAIICHEEKLFTPNQIATFFSVSKEAAGIRAERIAELEYRNAWGTSPLERRYRELYLKARNK